MVLEQWNEAVQSDVEVLKQVRIFIEQLKTPFGFLMDQVKKAQKNIVINAAKEKQQEEFMIGAAVILGLLIATSVFAFLYIKFA